MHATHSRFAGASLLALLALLLLPRAQAGEAVVVRQLAPSEPPPVAVVSMEGRKASFAAEASRAGPQIVNFVFTTCSTICSTQTATLAALAQRLRARGQVPHLFSLTIDPDNDTPEQLRKFASQFGIGPGWDFYSGRYDDLLMIQKYFDVYRGSKAAHPPVVMMRRGPGAPWVRVEGLAGAAQLEQVFLSLPPKS